MYITSRLLRASSGATQAAAAGVVTDAVEHINTNHGGQLNVGVQVGGDALLFGITGMYEHLSEYEQLRAALATDDQLQQIVQAGDGLFGGEVEDTIWRTRIDAGEPDVYAQVSSANVQLTSVSEAMAFCAEVSATVTAILGRPAGFSTAVTGNRSRILWLGFAGSMAQMEAEGEKLEENADYLDLFKRSEGLIVPNSLEQHIWQRIN